MDISPAVISPHHLNQLHASGLTDATIAAAGLRSVSDRKEVISKLNGIAIPAGVLPCLEIPYPDVKTGKLTGFSRFRFATEYKHTPPEEPGGHSGAFDQGDAELVKHAKYLSPAGTPTRLYMPVAIQPAILDPKTQLWIGEGEKKALAAGQAGLAMVGLPGIYNFTDAASGRASKGGGGNDKFLHRDFDHLHIEGREVVISYDSDIDTSPKVTKAAVDLGKLLIEAGAKVWIAYTDPLPGMNVSGKLGVDDLVAAGQREGGPQHPLDQLEDSVRPFNVYDLLEHLDEHRDDYPAKRMMRELARGARVARLLLPTGGDFDTWSKKAAKVSRVPAADVKAMAPKEEKEREQIDPRTFVDGWMKARSANYLCRGAPGAPLLMAARR